MMKKVLSVLGARPQFIKAAAVSRAINKADGINEKIIHTGQHFDVNMSDVFFKEMNIPKPDYMLNINSLSHGAMTGRMLEGIEKAIIKEEPDIVMVYGDTNSTISGALAAKKLHVKVAHVEAGLRSYNIKMPEEVNRILTDRISDILFCPTDTAISNLKKEGFDSFDIKIVKNGDVMRDTALYYSQQSFQRSNIIQELKIDDFILCTLHRAENTDSLQRMESIVNALNNIAKNIRIVLPLHPRTKKVLEKLGLSLDVNIIDPVGYFDMIELIKKSKLVVTDSGGLQKEAFFFSRNCVTLRDETEWKELLDYGYNVLAGSSKDSIEQNINQMLNKKSDFSLDLYGTGSASDIITEELLKL
jgi:UDP-GlcNAc3NAcA epimerase